MTRSFFFVLLALLAGCGGSSNVQLSSGGIPTAGFQGASTIGALFMIGVLAGASDGQARALPPELDAARKVNEQDCSKPIEDWSANLKCR
jgi:hypothetical protein